MCEDLLKTLGLYSSVDSRPNKSKDIRHPKNHRKIAMKQITSLNLS